MSNEAAIQDLIAKEEIRQAMARYARGIDRREEELVKSVYWEDSVDKHGFGLDGSGWDLAAKTRRDGTGFPEQWKTFIHFLGQTLIEVDGDRAVSESYFVSYQVFDDPAETEWSMTIHGRYADKWERRDGEFKIIDRVVIYEWIRTEPNRTVWPGPDHHVPKGFFAGPTVDLSTTVFAASENDPSYEVLGTLKGSAAASA